MTTEVGKTEEKPAQAPPPADKPDTSHRTVAMPLTSAGAPVETADNLSASFRVPLTSAGAPIEQAEDTSAPAANTAERVAPVEQTAPQEPTPPGNGPSAPAAATAETTEAEAGNQQTPAPQQAAAAPQTAEEETPQQTAVPSQPSLAEPQAAAAKTEPVATETETSFGAPTDDTTVEEQPSSVKDILASYAIAGATGSQRPIHDIISAYENTEEQAVGTAEPSAEQAASASEPASPPHGEQDKTPTETTGERSEMDALFAETATEVLPAEEQPVSPPHQPAKTTIQRDHLKEEGDKEKEEEEPSILFELTIPFPEAQDFKKISPLYWIGIAGFLLTLFILTISIWFLISFPDITGNPAGKTVQTTTYQAGEDVTFADVRWKLVGASQKDNPAPAADAAAGSLVLVRMEIENLTDEAVPFQPFTLIDAQEQIHPPSADPTLAATIPPEEQCLQMQLQPGQVQTCQLLFQPSPDAKDLKVQVADLDPSTEETALIDPGLALAE